MWAVPGLAPFLSPKSLSTSSKVGPLSDVCKHVAVQKKESDAFKSTVHFNKLMRECRSLVLSKDKDPDTVM